MSDFQALTKEAENLLSRGRDHRRTEQQLLQLKLHLKMIASWADHVPPETRFFFVEWQLVLIVPRVDGLSREELAIAAYLQPLHSQLGAIALQVLWKANQLIRTLCNALNAGDLIVGSHDGALAHGDDCCIRLPVRPDSAAMEDPNSTAGARCRELAGVYGERECSGRPDSVRHEA